MLRGRGGKVGQFRSVPCSWWLYLRFCSVSAWPEVGNPSLPRHFCFKAIVRPRVRNYCWGIGQFNLCRNMLRDWSLTNCCCLPPCNQLPAAVSVLGCKTMKSGTDCSSVRHSGLHGPSSLQWQKCRLTLLFSRQSDSKREFRNKLQDEWNK